MLKWTKRYRKEEGAAEEDDDDDNNNHLSDNSHSVDSPLQGTSTDDSFPPSPQRLSDQDPHRVGHKEPGPHSSIDRTSGCDVGLSPSETESRNTPSVESLAKTDNVTLGLKTFTSFTSSSSSSSSPSSINLPLEASPAITESSVFSSEELRTREDKKTASVSDMADSQVSGSPDEALTPSASETTDGTPPSPTPSSSASTSSPKQHHQPNMAASALPDVTKFVPGMDREALGPEVEWEEEDLTIAQIADMDNFPCIGFFEEKVREKDGQWEFLSAGLKIYSKQPVLLQMRSRKKQARVRTIFKDPQGAFFEVGQTMLIPDDYKGWFELVPSDFSRATCFMSIAEVAKNMPRKFFTRSNVKGIRIEGEGENQKYLERKVPAGSVLETKGTFTAKWKTSAETGTFKKKTKEWELQEVTYLKCIDHDQTELLVPLTHKGKFNAIYERGQLTQNAVYSMKDILSDLSLPIKVRLLFGKAPVVPCIFTGMLVVRSAAMDDAVVGSTILNTRNVLFEIPVDAPVKAKYQSSDALFEEMASYKDAQKLCKKYAKMFSTMIKLSPDMDTDQKVIQHVPSDPSVMRQKDESLRALDLITDISLTGEPKDHLLDSDSASMGSEDQTIIPKGGTLSELTEYKSRESHTHV